MKAFAFLVALAAVLLVLSAAVEAGSTAAAAASKKRPVIIDTDANTDDSIALLWLLKRSDLDIKAITVVGTGWASLSSGLTNVFNLLAFMGRNDIPVTWGGAYPLYEVNNNIEDCTYSKTIPNAPGGRQWADTLVGLAHCFPKAGPGRYYNPNAIGAVDLIAQVLNSTRDKVDILALGPATNIANLFNEHPWAKAKVGRVVFSGGAVYVGGNIFYNIPNTYAEYNALGDPDALGVVAKAIGNNLVLVPLDVTGQLIVNQTFLDYLGLNQYTSEASWVYSLLRTLQTQMGPVFNTYSLWDPYAAEVFADQTKYTETVRKVKVTFVTQDIDPTQVGRTKPDSSGTSVSVVLKPNDIAFDDLVYYLALEENSSPSPRCVESSAGGWYAW
jgi:inosine-uridine nucleoside N-ribohydrolase